MSTVTTARDLREINVLIGEAEREHDLSALDELLDDSLVFRRADGTIVGKAEFLDALPGRTYDMMETRILDVDERETSAVVTSAVRAQGTAAGTPFKGTYRNVRTFVQRGDRWRCTIWVNTRLALEPLDLHHASLPVTDLDRSRLFYREILGLREIERPPFDFPGAWYAVGPAQLHLIVGERSTFRTDKGVDSRDVHFAVRVRSYAEAKEFLESKGYSTDAPNLDPKKLKASPTAKAGFPQLYILDPDRNVIEINAEKLDE
jgi:catechol 2,3-dioxygenase-like lactoylglutathione lyase family enzyme